MDQKSHSNGMISVELGNEGKEQPQKPKILLVGINISHMSSTQQLCLLSTGVFFFYLFYGYFQELIFTHKQVKAHGLFLTFYQFVLYSLFALFEARLSNIGERRIPLATYVVISFLTVATMALSNSSLTYLNYPTQVIFKSCKLIPVLVGGIVIQRKQYGAWDFGAAAVMAVGLVWFTLADSTVSPVFDVTGVVMISLALLADAVIGNVQEKAMKTHHAANCEVVLYSYSIGLLMIGATLLLSGELVPGFQVADQYPWNFYGYGFLFSLTGYLGINVVLTLVRTSGAFVAVVVTTFRKAISIVISFVAFSKPFTIQYFWSGSLVLLGVYLNSISKKKSDSATPSEASLLQKVSAGLRHIYGVRQRHPAAPAHFNI